MDGCRKDLLKRQTFRGSNIGSFVEVTFRIFIGIIVGSMSVSMAVCVCM